MQILDPKALRGKQKCQENSSQTETGYDGCFASALSAKRGRDKKVLKEYDNAMGYYKSFALFLSRARNAYMEQRAGVSGEEVEVREILTKFTPAEGRLISSEHRE